MDKKTTKKARAAPKHRLPPGPGRPKGSQNKTTTQLKEAILEAAELAGGEDGLVGYLRMLAITNSSSFATLLGKVLPMQVTGADDGPVTMRVQWLPST